MVRLCGTIKKDEEVILENMEVSLTIRESRSGLKESHGTFKLMEFHYFEPRPYTLTLEDGRSMQINITGEISSPFPAWVRFEGLGPLE